MVAKLGYQIDGKLALLVCNCELMLRGRLGFLLEILQGSCFIHGNERKVGMSAYTQTPSHHAVGVSMNKNETIVIYAWTTN